MKLLFSLKTPPFSLFYSQSFFASGKNNRNKAFKTLYFNWHRVLSTEEFL